MKYLLQKLVEFLEDCKAMRIEKRDEGKPIKIWAVFNTDTASRGKCYTLLKGKELDNCSPAGCTYEFNVDGTESEILKKAIIL